MKGARGKATCVFDKRSGRPRSRNCRSAASALAPCRFPPRALLGCAARTGREQYDQRRDSHRHRRLDLRALARRPLLSRHLKQKDELKYASSKLTSIEINGTYYSTFKPNSWMKWRDETPDDFVFSVKASRFCTNRRVLSENNDSLEKFLSQGLEELGDKLGADQLAVHGHQEVRPGRLRGFPEAAAQGDRRPAGAPRPGGPQPDLRRPRSSTTWPPSTARPSSTPSTTRSPTWPRIDEPTADFTYARLMSSKPDEPTGMTSDELDGIATQTRKAGPSAATSSPTSSPGRRCAIRPRRWR
jgi:hypothetical protein